MQHRVNTTVEQIKNGNGDWDANRKLIAYIMAEHSGDIDSLYTKNRKLDVRLRNLEIRIAGYIGGASSLLFFANKFL